MWSGSGRWRQCTSIDRRQRSSNASTADADIAALPSTELTPLVVLVLLCGESERYWSDMLRSSLTLLAAGTNHASGGGAKGEGRPQPVGCAKEACSAMELHARSCEV